MHESMPHQCQHTEEGSLACEPCMYFGIIPAVLHVEVKNSNGGKSNFANLTYNISHITFSRTVGEDVEAFTRILN